MRQFRQALQRTTPAITAELTAPADRDVAAFCASARRLSPHVDALVVSERAMNRPISPVALAALLLREEIDPIPRLSRRGRNRIALLGELLGLRALGVTSLLLDEEPEEEIHSADGQKFTVDETAWIDMANDLGGTDWAGSPHEFLIGGQVAVPAAGGKSGIEALSQRAQAGLRFLHLRPGPDPAALRAYLDELVAQRVTWQCSVIITLDLREGTEACAEQADAVLAVPGVSGIHILSSGDGDELEGLLSLSGVDRKR